MVLQQSSPGDEQKVRARFALNAKRQHPWDICWDSARRVARHDLPSNFTCTRHTHRTDATWPLGDEFLGEQAKIDSCQRARRLLDRPFQLLMPELIMTLNCLVIVPHCPCVAFYILQRWKKVNFVKCQIKLWQFSTIFNVSLRTFFYNVAFRPIEQPYTANI